MSSTIGIQRRAADAQAGPTLKVSNEQALQMLRTKMAQRLSSQASGGELRRSFELLDRDKSGNVELAELEEASAAQAILVTSATARE
jgi:Ca2+-binding EF-hand superfamily protein